MTAFEFYITRRVVRTALERRTGTLDNNNTRIFRIRTREHLCLCQPRPLSHSDDTIAMKHHHFLLIMHNADNFDRILELLLLLCVYCVLFNVFRTYIKHAPETM